MDLKKSMITLSVAAVVTMSTVFASFPMESVKAESIQELEKKVTLFKSNVMGLKVRLIVQKKH